MASSAGRTEPPPLPRFERLGRFVGRHPRKLVAIWALLAAALALFGTGLDDEATVRPAALEGSAGQRERAIVVREFGRENAFVVLLEGPRAGVARQGRRLERALETLPDATVISPWDSGGSVDGLSPAPGVAGIVVSVAAADEDPTTALPPLRERIEAAVHPPVRASIAGAPAIADSFIEATKKAASNGERIAIPLLLIVLLLVFRSVLAAAVPVLIGGAVVAATRGVLDLLLAVAPVEFLALGAVGMMGLALGVDYSLLIVSRFREETGKGADPGLAAQRTVAATGPTVAMAGAGLSLAMAVSSLLLPGTLVTSVAIAVIAAAAISVLSALLVAPAILLLLGPRLERWALPSWGSGHGLALGWTGRLSKRPRAVVLPAIVVLLAAAVWALSLDTEMQSVGLLPADDRGRLQQEDVQRALGAGWVAPYEIVMDGGDRPVTTPERLRALAAFQRRVERDPGVATMTGVGGIERASRRLDGIEEALVAQRRGTERLGRGLARTQAGAAENTSGLFRAATGAQRLDRALGSSQDGARAAGTGSKRLAEGIERADGGGDVLADGTEKARAGARRLSRGLARAGERAGEITTSTRLLKRAMTSGDRRLAAAEASIQATEAGLAETLAALRAMTAGRADPQYGTALAAAERTSASLTGGQPGGEASAAAATGAGSETAEARGDFSLGLYLLRRLKRDGRKATTGVARLADGAARLERALGELSEGSQRVDDGFARLSEAGEQLAPALTRLGAGAAYLATGLARLRDGTGSLARGLEEGALRSGLLGGALARIESGVERGLQAGGGPAALLEGLPRLSRSGYFTLAGLDRSAPEPRRRAALLVSLDRGGHAARMVVVPRHAPAEEAAQETRLRLESEAERLARSTGSTVVVGGAGAEFQDLDEAFRSQSGPARLALALITVLILVPVMRSLAVPLIAALLNVLTVAATFGLMALLFDGALLGGPGYVDASVIPATIVVIFGLAIDYEVFLFARMREEYERTGSPAAAIERALERTAPVIGGAALIMIVVFLAFATSPFATIRNFGVAQAIAVVIDAFVVRLIVIPAVMRSMGSWAWWMPRWLDRLVPAAQRPR